VRAHRENKKKAAGAPRKGCKGFIGSDYKNGKHQYSIGLGYNF